MTSEISSDFSMLLVALAPFLAAFAAPWIKKFTPGYSGWVLAIIPASIFLFLLSFVGYVSGGKTLTFALPWVPVSAYFLGGTGIELSFFLDGLSLVFGLLKRRINSTIYRLLLQLSLSVLAGYSVIKHGKGADNALTR